MLDIELLSGDSHKTPFDDIAALVQVMAWCHQATSHYSGQCWFQSVEPYGGIRPCNELI